MLVIKNPTLPGGRTRDVRVDPQTGTIDAIARSLTASETLDASGKRLFPGMIDVHTHFREPGSPGKETWVTGSQSAAAGGVTTVVDQPNTTPPTVRGAAFDEKVELAARSRVDYGINGGVTESWAPDELFARPVFALGEVFLADSTGNMGIDGALFTDVVERAEAAGVVVTVHAEDADYFDETARSRSDSDAWSAYRPPEAEIAAIEDACAVGAEVGATLHFAHASTPAGIDIAASAGMTCEVTPHHMLLSQDDLDQLGSLGRMNPPLRRDEHRQSVYERVADGTVDMIATDHAPHTKAEKTGSVWDAPSGVPGVETGLPLLLAEASRGNLSYERVRDLTAAAPARVFDLPHKGRIAPGRDADLVLVDPSNSRPIRGADLHTKCDWTPFEGWDGVFPEWTMVRGRFTYRQGTFGEPRGTNVRQ